MLTIHCCFPLQAIYLMTDTDPTNSSDCPETRTSDIFHKMDLNSDGVLSKEEFIKGCLNDETLYKLLACSGAEELPCEWRHHYRISCMYDVNDSCYAFAFLLWRPWIHHNIILIHRNIFDRLFVICSVLRTDNNFPSIQCAIFCILIWILKDFNRIFLHSHKQNGTSGKVGQHRTRSGGLTPYCYKWARDLNLAKFNKRWDRQWD